MTPETHVLDAIRPLAPREAGRSGSYWYHDAAGTGWLEVVGAGRVALGEFDDAVRTLEIAERLGEPEVHRQPELGLAAVSALRTTNPYFLMAVGLALPAIGVIAFLRMLETGAAWWFLVVLGVMALILIGVGVYVLVQGIRRRSWWHRARAEGRRMGRPLPQDLRTWNEEPET